jgi:hypothetical protein
MRSFAQRGDTQVVDEPLYGHYLAVTDAPHPDRARLLEILETDAAAVIDGVILGLCSHDVLFMKQMVHHLTPDLDLRFLDDGVNVLLIRDPVEVISSLVKQLPEPTMRDVGLARQRELFDDLRRRGQDPPVIDARHLLLDPAHVLGRLCEHVGLAWDPAMLSWPAGSRPEDGPWAEHWYDSVRRSTGFAPYRPRDTNVPDSCRALLAECRGHYDELSRFAIPAPRAEAS